MSLALLAGSGCGGGTEEADTPPSIVTTSLPAGWVAVPYRAELIGSGGTGPLQWSARLPAGLALTSTATSPSEVTKAIVMGTPTEAGRFAVSVSVTDARGSTTAASLILTVRPALLQVETSELEAAMVGAPYEALLMASGGLPPYEWRLASGELPTGLTLDEEGRLSGRPERVGSNAFGVEVRDAEGSRAEVRLGLEVRVRLPLEIATERLPEGVADLVYTTSIEANHGTPPYRWRLVGRRPSGLTLASSGNPAQLTGTSTGPGLYRVSVELKDAAMFVTRRDFVLRIAPAPSSLTITSASLPAGALGRGYAASLAGSGGSGSGYRWQAPQGGLPPGLMLGSEGTPTISILGTPRQEGDFVFEVELQDDAGRSSTRDLGIEIVRDVIPLEMVTSSGTGVARLPDGELGELYTHRLEGRDGYGPYRWMVSDGQLPPGLRLEPSGTPSTRIVGIPTVGGSFTASIAVSADIGFDTRTFRIDISPMQILTTRIEDIRVCHPIEIALMARGGTGTNFQWSLVSGRLPPGLKLDPSGRLYGGVLAGFTGPFTFTLRVSEASGRRATRTYTVNLVDDGTGHRWAAFAGNFFPNERQDILVTETCRSSPSSPARASPPGPMEADFGDFKLSNDGKWLAYMARFPFRTRAQLYLVDLTRGPPYTPMRANITFSLEDTLGVTAFQWAPDSRHIVYNESSPAGVSRIYAVDTTLPQGGRTPVPLIPPDLDGRLFFRRTDNLFSPDGRYFLFPRSDRRNQNTRLWVYDFASGGSGTARRLLPTNQRCIESNPVWNPNSSSLLFFCSEGSRSELYLTELGPTLSARLVSHGVGGSEYPARNYPRSDTRFYGFSADGKYAYFVTISSPGQSIYRIDVTRPGRSPIRVFPPPGPYWGISNTATTRGSQLLFMGNPRPISMRELFVLDLSSSSTAAATIVSGPNVNSGPLNSFEVSPDGRKVVYLGSESTPGLINAHLVDLMASPPSSIPLTSASSDSLAALAARWAPTSDRLIIHGDLTVDERYEMYLFDLHRGPPYRPTPLNRPSLDERVVDFDVAWRVDGGGIVRIVPAPADAFNDFMWTDFAMPTQTRTLVRSAALYIGDLLVAVGDVWRP